MKKILFILLLAGVLVVSGCANGIDNNEECYLEGDTCCIGDKCIAVSVLCIEGTTPNFLGCDENCAPEVICE